MSIQLENNETQCRKIHCVYLIEYTEILLKIIQNITYYNTYSHPDENVLSMERSLIAIILKRIQEFCVNTRFFYLLERTFTSGHVSR
jgi:hypothetical protein